MDKEKAQSIANNQRKSLKEICTLNLNNDG